MTKKEVLNCFLEYNKPFNDYWEMQLKWEMYVDILERQGSISIRQGNRFGNPCKAENFKTFNKKFRG